MVNGSSRTLGDTIVNMGSGESFVYNLAFTIPSVNEGDHFTIQLSDTLDATGTSVLSDAVTIKSGDTVYATGVYDDATKTITYTFTAEAAAKSNLEASVSMPLFVDDITVPNTTSSATFTVMVNGNTQSLTEGVNYDAVHHSLNAYNISSRIVETNSKDNSLKFVAGINTDGSSIYNSQGLVSRVVTSSGTVDWDNATLKIYQTSPSSVYDSLHNNTSKLTDVTDKFSITRVNGTDRYNVAMDGYLINWGTTFISSSTAYVIVVETPEATLDSVTITASLTNPYYTQGVAQGAYHVEENGSSSASGDEKHPCLIHNPLLCRSLRLSLFVSLFLNLRPSLS